MTDDPLFNVIFSGVIDPSRDLDQVKAQLAKLLKVDKGRIDALFIGKPVVIQRSVSKVTAVKFQKAFAHLGVALNIEATDPNPAPSDHSEKPKQKLGTTLIAIDFETTGLDADEEAIVEIGAVRFSIDGTIDSSFSALCNPGKKIPARATKVHGIRDKDVADKPSAWIVWLEFLAWAGPHEVLVAHNAPFEMKFLVALHKKNGADIPKVGFVDTLALAQRRIAQPKSYKLIDLVQHLGIETDGAHRAAADALAVAHLLARIAETYKNAGSAIKRATKPLEEFSEELELENRVAESLEKTIDSIQTTRKNLRKFNQRMDKGALATLRVTLDYDDDDDEPHSKKAKMNRAEEGLSSTAVAMIVILIVLVGIIIVAAGGTN